MRLLLSQHTAHNRLMAQIADGAARTRRQLLTSERQAVLSVVMSVRPPSRDAHWFVCEQFGMVVIEFMRIQPTVHPRSRFSIYALYWTDGGRKWASVVDDTALSDITPNQLMATLSRPTIRVVDVDSISCPDSTLEYMRHAQSYM